MRVRIITQPTGLLNGREWPVAGEEFELPDVVGADACAAGWAEPAAVRKSAEKRPAKKAAETRKA